MDSPRFTAILMSWQRQHNFPTILASLRAISHIDEIIVWNNNPDVELEFPGVLVINSPKNFMCWARYAAALLAKNEHIWFQDDDLMLTPEQFEQIYQRYVADPSRIHCARGRNIVDGRYVAAEAFGDVDIALGQTMMFHRRVLRDAFLTLGTLPRPTIEDDIAFSLSTGRKHDSVDVGPIQDLGMSDAAALYRRPEHLHIRQRAVETYGSFVAARQREENMLHGELEALRTEVRDLRGSTAVQVAEMVRQLPGSKRAIKLLRKLVVGQR